MRELAAPAATIPKPSCESGRTGYAHGGPEMRSSTSTTTGRDSPPGTRSGFANCWQRTSPNKLAESGAHRLSHTVDRAIQPTPDPDTATILVCDDDPSLRELVRAVLGPRYRFIEAADGTEALVAAREL